MGSELEALNRLCRDVYESIDPATRAQTERHLSDLLHSDTCLQTCMLLLERGQAPYGQMVAVKTLMKLLGIKPGIMPQDRLELCRYLLSYLGNHAPQMPQFVITEMCQLFGRITKLEWGYFDRTDETYPFRTPIASIVKTISFDNIQESLLAIELLSLLVADLNDPSGMDSVSAHRKSSAGFRDEYLLQIFKMSTDLLKEVTTKQLKDEEVRMTNSILQLCLNCLLFDFIGSLADETSEDNSNMQVPTCWRDCFTDGSLIKLVITLYKQLPQSCIPKVIHILVQLAIIRRTLFGGNERQQYLREIICGIISIIDNPEKLNDQAAFHEFCRLVSRIKVNFQLNEMIKVSEYSGMLDRLAQFTVTSLKMMEVVLNSSYFLLNFWQRMVTSVPYVRTADEHLLEIYCPEIFKVYVETQLILAQKVITEGFDDPLEDQGSIIQIMEQLAVICRCKYKATAELLIVHFDENAAIVLSGQENTTKTKVALHRVVWLTTLMGTAIFGKTSGPNCDDNDILDGQMLLRVLKFMAWNDARLQFPAQLGQNPINGNLRLEVAFIHMLEQFRRAYILEQVARTSLVYSMLSECGINDELDLLNLIVRKIITNLKMWPTNADILELSLSLLKDLSLGYTAVRKLFSLPDIQLLLSNHTAEHFAFLGPEVDYRTMKERTTFYEALTRLLASDVSDDEAVFHQYMQPLTDTVRGLTEVMNTNSSHVNVVQIQKVLVGLCRDLRGITVACTSKALFQILLDWILPDLFNILHKAVSAWSDIPEVICPIFRFIAELVQNRQQRLKFEMSSAAPVLLFREVSKIICSWGENALNSPITDKADVYKLRYKNIGIVFCILRQCLAGAYVPFGVFRLYGDMCLQNALNMYVKLFRIIPEDEFLKYGKIAQNFYQLLETIMQDNMTYISNLDVDTVAALSRAISTGMLCIDAVVITAASSSLDILVNYIFKRFTRDSNRPPSPRFGVESDGDTCVRVFQTYPGIFADLLSELISITMFGELKCQWSVSRPLIGLILLQEHVFNEIKQNIISHQPSARHVYLNKTFDALMSNVDFNLSVKNKDTFTQNLSKFRRDALEIGKGKQLSPASSNSNMVF